MDTIHSMDSILSVVQRKEWPAEQPGGEAKLKRNECNRRKHAVEYTQFGRNRKLVVLK